MTVAIADDVQQIRTLVARIIARTTGLTLVGAADDFPSVFELLESTRPDIALIDCSMPGPDPVAAFQQLRARFPQTRLVLLTGTPADDLEPDLLRAVDGCIDKCLPLPSMVAELEALTSSARPSLAG